MKKTLQFALVAAFVAAGSPAAFAAKDCLTLAVSVRHAVAAKPADVLAIVEKEIAASPDCACELVKAAIEGAAADSATVAAIVETAASVAPEHLRLISQCALAVAPDALSEVQGVVARLTPNQGEVAYSDAKSAKSPKGPIDVKPAWNPLDFPGEGIGPNPGSPGGLPLLPPGPPIFVPPIVNPPDGTPINFAPFVIPIRPPVEPPSFVSPTAA